MSSRQDARHAKVTGRLISWRPWRLGESIEIGSGKNAPKWGVAIQLSFSLTRLAVTAIKGPPASCDP